MRKLLCKIGIHNYESVNMTDCFTTNIKSKDFKIKHIVWYQSCSCCGKRRLKDNYKKDIIGYMANDKHAGIEYARLAWERYNNMYLGEGQVLTPPSHPPKPAKTPNLKVIDGGKND
jgi:endo-beta-N-acetylglucosaminidase D